MVIDVAVIASLPHLGDLAACGSIDMALTHLALRHPGYAEHHAARAAAGGTVLLDNSAYELADTLGSGLDAGPVLTAAALTGASEVTCTDVPYDGPATLTTTRRVRARRPGPPADPRRHRSGPPSPPRTQPGSPPAPPRPGRRRPGQHHHDPRRSRAAARPRRKPPRMMPSRYIMVTTQAEGLHH